MTRKQLEDALLMEFGVGACDEITDSLDATDPGLIPSLSDEDALALGRRLVSKGLSGSVYA